jgi:hypothetical protein
MPLHSSPEFCWEKKVLIILCSSGIFCSLEWQLVTDVLGQPIGPVFKDQAVTGGS